MTIEESQNQDKNLSSPKSDTDYPSSESDFARKIENLSDTTLKSCAITKPAQSVFYRVQNGYHCGSCVYFNKNGSDTRFGLNDGINGSMYVAVEATTALKEVFQNMMSIMESDLDRYYIGRVVTKKEMNILDIRKLLTMTNINLNNVTTPLRFYTQSLAKKVHAAGFDGILFPSNVTGGDCLVLWDDASVNGADIVDGKELLKLSSFCHDGQSITKIMVYQLGISVELE